MRHTQKYTSEQVNQYMLELSSELLQVYEDSREPVPTNAELLGEIQYQLDEYVLEHRILDPFANAVYALASEIYK